MQTDCTAVHVAVLQREIVEVDVNAAGTTGRVLATTPEEHGVGGWVPAALLTCWLAGLLGGLASCPGRESCQCQHTTSRLSLPPSVAAAAPCCLPAEGMRFNDGKVSPAGSLLVGRMHNKWRDGERGRLYRLDPSSR